MCQQRRFTAREGTVGILALGILELMVPDRVQLGFYYPILGRVGTKIPCPFSDQLWTFSLQGIQILGTAQKYILRGSNIEGCSSLPL